MIFLRRLVSFLMVLSVTLYIAYFSYVNTKPIHIIVPPLGELRMPAAIGFLGSFLAGAIFTCLFFLYEYLKKVLELHSVKKELKLSESSNKSVVEDKISYEAPITTSPKPSKNLDFFSSMDDEPNLDDINTKN